LLKLPIKYAVESRKATSFAAEDKIGIIECIAIDKQIRFCLGSDLLQPLALRGRPVFGGQYIL
jgi:hypothetical protein